MRLGLRARMVTVFALLFAVVAIGAAGTNYLLLRNTIDAQRTGPGPEEFTGFVEEVAAERNVDAPELQFSGNELTSVAGASGEFDPFVSPQLEDGRNALDAADQWLRDQVGEARVDDVFELDLASNLPSTVAELDQVLFTDPLAILDEEAPGTSDRLFDYLAGLRLANGEPLLTERPQGDGDICAVLFTDCELLVTSLTALEPFQLDEGTLSIVEEAAERSLNEAGDQALATQLRTSVAIALASIVLAIGAAWLVTNRLLRPVQQVTAAAKTASADSLSSRIALDGPDDELMEMANTFDAMLERLEKSFDAQRRFGSNAAHELKTPLAVMRAEIDAARLDDVSGEGQQLLDRLEQAARRSERLVETLLDLARAESSSAPSGDADLTEIVSEALLARSADLASRELAVNFEVPETGYDTVLPAHRDLLDVLAVNLIDNAAKYATVGSELLVRVRSSADRIELRMVNEGPELSAATIDGLLEPFARGEARTGDGGHGLGLSIVAAVARAHRAEVDLIARRGGGLIVVINFPTSAGRRSEAKTERTARPIRPSGPSVSNA